MHESNEPSSIPWPCKGIVSLPELGSNNHGGENVNSVHDIGIKCTLHTNAVISVASYSNII